MDGRGIYTWEDGNIYEGNWRENKMSGFGVFRWPDGKEYKGQFQDNQMEGKGKMKAKNGNLYEGIWMDGKMEGSFEVFLEGRLYRREKFEKGKCTESELVREYIGSQRKKGKASKLKNTGEGNSDYGGDSGSEGSYSSYSEDEGEGDDYLEGISSYDQNGKDDEDILI